MLKKANTLAYWPSAYGHQGKATCKMSYRKTHHPYDIGVYKKLKNKLKSSVHEAKLHYLQSLLEKSKCDPHSFHDLWLDVNNIIGRRKSSVGATNFNVSPDSLNNFFTTVAVTDEHQPATQFTPFCDSSASSFHFTPVNLRICYSISISKSLVVLMDFPVGFLRRLHLRLWNHWQSSTTSLSKMALYP